MQLNLFLVCRSEDDFSPSCYFWLQLNFRVFSIDYERVIQCIVKELVLIAQRAGPCCPSGCRVIIG